MIPAAVAAPWFIVLGLLGSTRSDDFAIAHFVKDNVAAGETAILKLEIFGECAADAELLPFPAVDGVEFETIAGPAFSVRSPRGGVGADEYICEYTIGVRSNQPGEYLIRDVGVLCQTDERLVTNPIHLRVSATRENVAPVRFTVTPDRQEVYARQPFAVRFRLEIDVRVSPALTAGNSAIVLPWWNDVVPLEKREGPLANRQKRFEIEDGYRSLQFDVVRESLKDGAFYEILVGQITVLAPAAGTIDLGRSTFRFRVSAGGADPPNVAPAPSQIVTVRPLPTEGRPPDYGTAVGALSVAVGVDRRELAVGDSLNVEITIGEIEPDTTNVTTAEFPPFGDVFGFRCFQEEGRLDGRTRVVRLLLAPTSESIRELPSFRIAWFDPDAGRYDTASTPPIPLTVHPHPEGERAGERPPAGGWPPAPLRVLLPISVGIVLLVILGIATRRRTKDSPVRSTRNDVDSLAEMERAVASLETPSTIAEARAFARYLAARLGSEPGRCFGAEAATLLTSCGAPEALARDVSRYFESVERATFGRQVVDLSGRAISLAREVDQALRPTGSSG